MKSCSGFGRATITTVDSGSPADVAGIEVGDVLLSIDGHPVRDIIDYQFFASDEVELEVRKIDGSILATQVLSGDSHGLGIGFDEIVFDCERRCSNKCVFCFIDQLPKGLRTTLYFKDDDYRLSFLQGNFVTLTNLSEVDIDRIVSMRLSPLYVSVHASDESVRRTLLGREASPPIMPLLRRFAGAGVEVHAQIVLTPGINDGEVLVRTIQDLSGLAPGVASVGIVPVGLSRHRSRLRDLAPVTAQIAREVIDTVERFQGEFRNTIGTGLVYAADEFFFLAGLGVPEAKFYDDYAQLENGIGIARVFLDDFAQLEPGLPASIARRTRLIVVSGLLGARAIHDTCERLNRIGNVQVDVLPVPNDFFGRSITVTGLVVGKDIVKAVRAFREHHGTEHDIVVVPDIMLKRGDDVFLDDMTPEELETAIGVPLMLTESSAEGLVDAAIDGVCEVN